MKLDLRDALQSEKIVKISIGSGLLFNKDTSSSLMKVQAGEKYQNEVKSYNKDAPLEGLGTGGVDIQPPCALCDG